MFFKIQGTRLEYDIETYRNHRRFKADPDAKYKVAAGALLGTAIPVIYLAKKQDVSPFKINYKLKEMLTVSISAIAGGVLAGIFTGHKEHRKQKMHEGVFQLMNSSVPALLTASLFSLSKRFKCLDNVPYKIGSSLLGIGGGIYAAAKLSNFINDPYDKIPDRKLTIKDSVANIDDAIGVLVLAKVPAVQKIPVDKALPAIYGWCGYRAGMSN